MKQDWRHLMGTLATQARDLELLQPRAALDHLMLQPTRIKAIWRHMHVGQLDARAPGCFVKSTSQMAPAGFASMRP